MKIIGIVQARMGSTRFPGKVMRAISGVPMIGLLLERLSKSNKLTKIIVATSKNTSDDALENYVKSLKYSVYRGDEGDVLKRFYLAAKQERADVIIRITGDCPLIDAELVDEVIEGFVNSNAGYASNREPPTYPDGLDVEVFSMHALELAHVNASESLEREHVTPYIINSDHFKKFYLQNSEDLSEERWTVDELEDFSVIESVFFGFFSKGRFFLARSFKATL